MKTLVRGLGWIPVVLIVFSLVPWGGNKTLSTLDAVKFFAQFLALFICGALFAFTFSRRFKDEK